MYPVSVNSAGEPSAALALTGLTMPESQRRLTLTEAGLLSLKSFLTRNLALRRVLVIVHSPALSAAAHVPVES